MNFGYARPKILYTLSCHPEINASHAVEVGVSKATISAALVALSVEVQG